MRIVLNRSPSQDQLADRADAVSAILVIGAIIGIYVLLKYGMIEVLLALALGMVVLVLLGTLLSAVLSFFKIER